jgi:hypothetical protein
MNNARFENIITRILFFIFKPDWQRKNIILEHFFLLIIPVGNKESTDLHSERAIKTICKSYFLLVGKRMSNQVSVSVSKWKCNRQRYYEVDMIEYGLKIDDIVVEMG